VAIEQAGIPHVPGQDLHGAVPADLLDLRDVGAGARGPPSRSPRAGSARHNAPDPARSRNAASPLPAIDRSRSERSSASAGALRSGVVRRERRMPAMTSAMTWPPRCGAVCPARLWVRAIAASARPIVGGLFPAAASTDR
jgi:hypothetical protein